MLTWIPKERIGLDKCYFRWQLQASFLCSLLVVCQLAVTLLKSGLLFPKSFSCVSIFHGLTKSALRVCTGTSTFTFFIYLFLIFSPQDDTSGDYKTALLNLCGSD